LDEDDDYHLGSESRSGFLNDDLDDALEDDLDDDQFMEDFS
jgi:hypothetical protein